MLQTSFAQFGKASKVELPATYDFDYIYTLKITHKKGDATLDYYLKKDAKYFGFNSQEISQANKDGEMFMVMDGEREVTAMFMSMAGKKIVQKTKFDASTLDADDDTIKDYDFKQIESKIINGYKCEGFISESDTEKITFYITADVPVSLNQAFGNNSKNLPKGFNPDWMKKYANNGLMMEMTFEDKKKAKNNVTMECVQFEKTDFSIDTTKYGSMMGAFGG